MVLPFESVIQHTVNCYNLRRQGVVLRDNEPLCFELGKIEQKTKLFTDAFFRGFKTCLFNYTATERLHGLAVNSTGFKSITE